MPFRQAGPKPQPCLRGRMLWEFHSVTEPRPSFLPTSSFPRKRESSASFWIPGLRSTKPGMTIGAGWWGFGRGDPLGGNRFVHSMHHNGCESWHWLVKSRPVALAGAPDWCVERTLPRLSFRLRCGPAIRPSSQTPISTPSGQCRVSCSRCCGRRRRGGYFSPWCRP